MPGRAIDTPRVQEQVLTALKAGNTRRASCGYAGVSEDTFARWLDIQPDFAEQVKKAEADAEVRHVANIAKAAGKGTWQASAWWLERKQYQDWRRRDEVSLKQLTDDELIERAKAAFGRDAAPWLALPDGSDGPEPVPD